MAPGWGRRIDDIERMAGPVREWLVRELDPEPGDTVLELAAGPGSTGFEAAVLIGERGRLISTDFSPAMVDVARRRSLELRLGNVEHRVMDAEHLELEDDAVDGVLCRFGFMLMPDPAAALAETRRVLRQGGKLAFAVWRGPERNPWISLAGRILVGRGHVPPPDPAAPGMFTFADEDRVRALLDAAGFRVERLEDVPVVFTSKTVDDYVASAQDTGGVFSTVWRGAADEERAAIVAELAEAFAPYATGEGYELPGVALGVAAV